MVQIIDSISSGEIIAIIFSSVLAIVAIWTVFLNYKYRPTRIVVLKEHTEHLRIIADEWRNQLPEIPNVTSNLILKYPKRMDVEKRTLYDDLIVNHLPSELKILETWDELRKSIVTLLDTKKELISSMKNEIGTRTGLEEYDSKLKTPGYTESLLYDIMKHKENRVREGSNSFGKNEIHEWEVLGSNYVLVKARDENHVKECLKIIEELQNGEKWDEQFKKMYQQWDECISLDKGMKRILDDLHHYPFLPGQDCRFLKSP